VDNPLNNLTKSIMGTATLPWDGLLAPIIMMLRYRIVSGDTCLVAMSSILQFAE
jgi:hypothetical protein